MSSRADTKPLETPLPGGHSDATVVVEPVITGSFTVPQPVRSSPEGPLRVPALLRAARGKRTTQPVPAFLIRHPGAGPLLVDTGIHSSVAGNPVRNLGRLENWFYRPRLEPGRDLASQLREKEVEPSSIGLVLMTHLHLDHASAVTDFPDATFVVDAKEWREANRPLPWSRGYRRNHFNHPFDFRTVSFERATAVPYGGLDRTIDLFGDGSVRLVATPGDTVGHQSVLVRLKDRPMLIGGDATYLNSQFEPDADQPGVMADPEGHRRSLEEIRRFRSRFPEAVITPGHDVDFYRSLPERFE
ncbi:MAG: N-acyl homoserine lactonase family protein [Solirubrobacterales bacterium]|nr:N-acyl homoserine lactonase family protein [Solirubrobacterales bacterium]